MHPLAATLPFELCLQSVKRQLCCVSAPNSGSFGHSQVEMASRLSLKKLVYPIEGS